MRERERERRVGRNARARGCERGRSGRAPGFKRTWRRKSRPHAVAVAGWHAVRPAFQRPNCDPGHTCSCQRLSYSTRRASLRAATTLQRLPTWEPSALEMKNVLRGRDGPAAAGARTGIDPATLCSLSPLPHSGRHPDAWSQDVHRGPAHARTTGHARGWDRGVRAPKLWMLT